MRTITVALANVQRKDGEWVVLRKGDPLPEQVTAEETARLDGLGAISPEPAAAPKKSSSKPDKEG